ncbi:hypothetical protein JCM33374_g5505 [Metschnikowia sp. JCM 33374]|nr:hypothetical protein JCM33374_g5505 [Metschnikowia sp. JCM 33374]
MYQQTNHSYDSLGVRSSNNPFRQSSLARPPQSADNLTRASSTSMSNTSSFNNWVHRNKSLVSDSSDEEPEIFQRPSLPSSRTASDTNVNYNSATPSLCTQPRFLGLPPKIPAFNRIPSGSRSKMTWSKKITEKLKEKRVKENEEHVYRERLPCT